LRSAHGLPSRHAVRPARAARLPARLLRPSRLGALLGEVTVRLFAGLRERAGWSRREVTAATVADVWPALGLGDEPAGLLYAVNRAYVERGRELADGDEVALIPPVSGGSFLLVEGPLDVAALVPEVEDPAAGT